MRNTNKRNTQQVRNDYAHLVNNYKGFLMQNVNFNITSEQLEDKRIQMLKRFKPYIDGEDFADLREDILDELLN